MKFVIFFIILGIIFLFNGFFLLSLLIIGLPISLLAMAKRTGQSFLLKHKKVTDRCVMVCPCFGRVKSIEQKKWHPFFGQNVWRVEIITSPIDPFGFYFPLKSEMIDLQHGHNSGSFRFLKSKKTDRKAGKFFKWKYNDSTEYGIQVVSDMMSGIDQYVIESGDLGEKGAFFGSLSFGGRVFVYFPQKWKLLIKTGDKVCGPKTLLAHICSDDL